MLGIQTQCHTHARTFASKQVHKTHDTHSHQDNRPFFLARIGHIIFCFVGKVHTLAQLAMMSFLLFGSVDFLAQRAVVYAVGAAHTDSITMAEQGVFGSDRSGALMFSKQSHSFY